MPRRQIDPQAARAELGVATDASPEEIRAAFEERVQLLDAAGLKLALARVVEAYRALAPDVAAAPLRVRSGWRRLVGPALALTSIFVGAALLATVIAHERARPGPPSPQPSGGVAGRVATPPPASAVVLQAADIGPGYRVLRSGPAALGNFAAGADGWDVVYQGSDPSSPLVESIAVVYPSAGVAAQAAESEKAAAPSGAARAVGTVGVVVVVVAVAPDSAPSQVEAQRLEELQVRRTASVETS